MRAAMHDGRMRVVSSWPWLRVALILLVAGAAVCERAAAQRPTSFACKRLLAPDGRSWLEDQVVGAMGPSIFEVRARREGEDVDRDFGDAWVIPGLIDLHTHLADVGQGADIAEPIKRDAAETAFIGARNAYDTLMAGFTSVRDVGSFRAFGDVRLRDAIDKLALNDASFSHEMETSAALGFGFRCGFTGGFAATRRSQRPQLHVCRYPRECL